MTSQFRSDRIFNTNW